jgi:hypothetical protein
MKSLAIIIPLVLGIMFAVVPAARAADTSCINAVLSGPINGNVVVPNGDSCDLEAANVTGNVLVGKGAFLMVGGFAPGSVTISGNVNADHCFAVQIGNLAATRALANVSVGGNVVIQSCGGELSGYEYLPFFGSITIGGNFLCQSNSQPCVAMSGSIGGNANVSDNSGGHSLVSNNKINGNLLCFGNTGAVPAVSNSGITNMVAGKELGQCGPPPF